jgi:hypothetical protein
MGGDRIRFSWLLDSSGVCHAPNTEDIRGTVIYTGANNAMHTDSAITLKLNIGDHLRGAGDGERWAALPIGV